MEGIKANQGQGIHDSLSNNQYRLSRLRGGGRVKADQFNPAVQQQNLQQQLQLQQQQHQALLAQSNFGSPAGAAAAAGVINMPSYADQMQAAFLDYQRQRVEFEQQQQQLLQNLYHHYPDVSGAQAQQQQQQQPAQGLQGANGFVYQRPQFGSNGLQPGGSARPGALRTVGAGGDFYSTQQQQQEQQQQDVLREQQQLLAPSTRQNFGMAVPMSSVLSAPLFQPSSDVSHVSFSSGNLKYSF